MNKIEEINMLMKEFYEFWESENTSELLIQLSGKLDTEELKLDIEQKTNRLKKIENIFCDEKNFEEICENWTLIDLKLLDVLIDTFKMNIDKFIEFVINSKDDSLDDIKNFFGDRI